MDINTWFREQESYGITLRRELHRNPELSGQEHATSALIRRELKAMGIAETDIGLETGVVADITGTKEGAGKIIAIRADIDALPVTEQTGLPFASQNEGISHACGHDLHTAALLLTAKFLSENRGAFSGKVRLMFQPSEEVGKGALTLISKGVLEPRTDYVLGVHTWPDTPAGKIGVRFGTSHASSDTVKIVVRGKGGHGAHPYRCVDPVVTAGYLLTQMQSIVSRELSINEGSVLTFGMIRGGTAPNVIPDSVELQGTLRTLTAAQRKHMQESIWRVAKSCCEAMRAEAEVTITEGMPPLENDPAVAGAVRDAAQHVLGAENVEELKAASPGSDDFAFYLEKVPGALFRMGTGNEDPSTHIGLHNAKNTFDERGIAVAARVLAETVLELLN